MSAQAVRIRARRTAVSPSAGGLLLFGLSYWLWLLPALHGLAGWLSNRGLGIALWVPGAAVFALGGAGWLLARRYRAPNGLLSGASLTAIAGNGVWLLLRATLGDSFGSGVWWGWAAIDTVLLVVGLGARRFAPPVVRGLLAGLVLVGLLGAANAFVEQVACAFPSACQAQRASIKPEQPELVLAGYGPYNIVRFGGKYFGIPQSAGAFSLDLFRAGAYADAVDGSTLADVQALLDRNLSLTDTGTISLTPELVRTDYHQFNILRFRGGYVGIPQSEGVFQGARLDAGGYAGAVQDTSLQSVLAKIDLLTRDGPEAATFALRQGFYPSEGADGAPLPRWAGGAGTIEFFPTEAGPVVLTMRIVQPQSDGRPEPDLAAILDGAGVRPLLIGRNGARYDLQLVLDRGARAPGLSHLVLLSPVFIPSATDPNSRDVRSLGVQLESLELRSATTQLSLFDLPVQPPLTPATAH